MPYSQHQRFYIDLRSASSTAQLSLDLSRHLPYRVSIGKSVIVSTRPRVLCSVLSKRWISIVNEIEIQHCLTLDKIKKRQLALELAQLKQVKFSSKANENCTILLASAKQAANLPHRYSTLYITEPPEPDSLPLLCANLMPGGLVVIYQNFWPEYARALQAYIPQAFSQK